MPSTKSWWQPHIRFPLWPGRLDHSKPSPSPRLLVRPRTPTSAQLYTLFHPLWHGANYLPQPQPLKTATVLSKLFPNISAALSFKQHTFWTPSLSLASIYNSVISKKKVWCYFPYILPRMASVACQPNLRHLWIEYIAVAHLKRTTHNSEPRSTASKFTTNCNSHLSLCTFPPTVLARNVASTILNPLLITNCNHLRPSINNVQA